MDYLEALRRRYSVKKFEPDYRIAAESLENILLAGRLSVSSLGMQPYYIRLISNREDLSVISPSFYNKSQVDSCSMMMVFITKTHLLGDYLEKYTRHIGATRDVQTDQLERFKQSIAGYLSGKTPEEISHWAAQQAYICLGSMVFAAALEEIDTCPLEGFDPKQLNLLLKLPPDENSAVCLALGKRASDDPFSELKKVRKPVELLYRYGL